MSLNKKFKEMSFNSNSLLIIIGKLVVLMVFVNKKAFLPIICHLYDLYEYTMTLKYFSVSCV